MPFRTICPHCDSPYQVGEQFLGKHLLCKKCQNQFLAQPVEAGALPVAPAGISTNKGVSPVAASVSPPLDKTKPAAKSALPWIIGGVVVSCLGLFMLLSAAAVSAWFLVRSPTALPPAPATTVAASLPAEDPRKPEETLPVADVPAPEIGNNGKDPAPPKTPPAPRGQLSAPTLKQLKDATVFIKVDAGRLSCTGSGFLCKIDGDTGYVITNHHVINPEAEMLQPVQVRRGRTTTYDVRVVKFKANNAAVSAVFNSGGKNEQIIRADVVATDGSRDLAVLRVKGVPSSAKPIGLDQKAELVETMQVYILGFPFGEALALKKGNPAITVNKGSISSLRENEFSQMKAVQIDGAINPGNSGGPVVDEQGRLVGISVATIKGAGIGLAIAPDELTRMFQGRAGAIEFKPRRVDTTVAEYDIDLQLIDPMEQIKSVALLYRAAAVAELPLKPNPDGSFNPMPGAQRAELKVDKQAATGALKFDRPRGFLVFQTEYVNGSGKAIYTNVVSKPILQGAMAVVPPEIPNRPQPKVDPVDPKQLGVKPPVLGKDQSSVNLPAAIADVAVGGAGRYLILHLPAQRKLAIFDTSEGKIVNYISAADDSVFFAAGAEKLILVLGTSKVIQRWSLKTFEREVAAPLPVSGVVKTICMGHASNGPLLIHWAEGTGALDRAPIDFLDIQALKLHSFETVAKGLARARLHHSYRDNMHFRASADGRTFGAWCTGQSPTGLGSIVITGNTIDSYYDHTSTFHVVPGPDGRTLFTGNGLYTAEVKAIGGEKRGPNLVLPALHGQYYLRVEANRDFRARNEDLKTSVALHMVGDDRPIAQLPQLQLPNLFGMQARNDFTYDKRVYFVPDAKLVVSIPGTNDRLDLLRFDIDEALAKSDVDYLLVTSRPPATASRGKMLEYAVIVKSKKGGVKYKIASGPSGMKVSESGKLTWDIPADFADRECDVILSVTDSTGQEAFQTFKLAIEK